MMLEVVVEERGGEGEESGQEEDFISNTLL
jgi:hypothetical protein